MKTSHILGLTILMCGGTHASAAEVDPAETLAVTTPSSLAENAKQDMFPGANGNEDDGQDEEVVEGPEMFPGADDGQAPTDNADNNDDVAEADPEDNGEGDADDVAVDDSEENNEDTVVTPEDPEGEPNSDNGIYAVDENGNRIVDTPADEEEADEDDLMIDSAGEERRLDGAEIEQRPLTPEERVEQLIQQMNPYGDHIYFRIFHGSEEDSQAMTDFLLARGLGAYMIPDLVDDTRYQVFYTEQGFVDETIGNEEYYELYEVLAALRDEFEARHNVDATLLGADNIGTWPIVLRHERAPRTRLLPLSDPAPKVEENTDTEGEADAATDDEAAAEEHAEAVAE